MCDLLTRGPSICRSCVYTVALVLALAAAGCERSRTTGGSVRPAPPSGGMEGARPMAQGVAATQPAATRQAAEAPRKFIAYYFHRTLRCATCLSIEKQAQDAIEAAYDAELSAGTLEWRPLNIEEPGNEHFEQDFALDRQALTLVELRGARVQRHKKLQRVWELVDDPYAFQEYVVAEVALFLGGG
jgi:hypothetical protein